MKKIGMYPGSFDPMTKGHMDIVKKALTIFDEVVIAVLENSAKTMLFTPDERKKMIEEIYMNDERVRCISLGSKLTINLAEEISAKGIIRGLRAMSDFEYEFQIANINRSQNEKIESIFFTATDKFTYVSSSMVKEIALYKGKVDEFVDPVVKKELEKKFN
ncbi:pantetheine-phosphate adenylyltransferase [SAR86 cluster bacterium]|nr:pantetheine-phosphate adenylyltransferase [SAR86 cluster bacterium]